MGIAHNMAGGSISKRTKMAVIVLIIVVYAGLLSFSFLVSRDAINKPFPGFLVLDNNVVSVIWLEEWEGFQAGIKVRDVVLSVDGIPVEDADRLYEVVNRYPIGTPLEYELIRAGHNIKLTIPVSLFTKRDYLACSLLWTLFGLAYLAMGLGVFYLRPQQGAGRAFLFGGVVGAFITATIWEQCVAHVNTLPIILMPLIGPSVTLIALYFPTPFKYRHKIIALLVITTLPIMFFYRYTFHNARQYLMWDTIYIIHMLFTQFFGVGIMIYSFLVSTDQVVRKKGKMVLVGFIATLVGASIVMAGVYILDVISLNWLVIPLLLIPFSLAYAIQRNELFDVDAFLLRALSYSVASAMALIVFLVSVGLFSLLLQDLVGQSSQWAAVLATMLMMLLFRPVQRRLKSFLDKRFMREKYEFRQTIRKASEVLSSIIDIEVLLNQMLETVLDAVGAERGLILLKDSGHDRFRLASVRDYSAGFRPEELDIKSDEAEVDLMDPSQPMYHFLQLFRKPITLTDIEESEVLSEDRDQLLKFVYDLEIIVVIPIIYEEQLTGMLGLGHKRSGEYYSNEDLDLLYTLMMQTSVSIENARKVDELKKMIEIESSYRELKQINDMKDNFFSMISHDLRTPMTAIKGYACLLHDKPDFFDEEAKKNYLNIIIEETDRLTRLISDILDIQRFESGKIELDMRSFDIVDIVRESLNLFEAQAMLKKLTYEKRLPMEKIRITCDRDRISQVMANLLSNAIKFTGVNGSIITQIERVSYNGGEGVKVSITDSGPGIADDKMCMLFQKYHQVENLVRAKEEGSGLGLALVREIIESHKGLVGVESKVGEGSTFYFILNTL